MQYYDSPVSGLKFKMTQDEFHVYLDKLMITEGDDKVNNSCIKHLLNMFFFNHSLFPQSLLDIMAKVESTMNFSFDRGNISWEEFKVHNFLLSLVDSWKNELRGSNGFTSEECLRKSQYWDRVRQDLLDYTEVEVDAKV